MGFHSGPHSIYSLFSMLEDFFHVCHGSSLDTYLKWCLILVLFHQCRDIIIGRGIDFGADPVGFSVGVGVRISLSCLHNILWTSGRILTKFSMTNGSDITRNWLYFGDLDLNCFDEVQHMKHNIEKCTFENMYRRVHLHCLIIFFTVHL